MSAFRCAALVTGGAGFIGTNLTDRLVREGKRVRVLDNLSRAGVSRNLEWLQRTHGDRVEFVHGDVRDRAALDSALKDVSQVFHLAAQVAVTTSMLDPTTDFEVNARGTLNLLEAIRARKEPLRLLYTSTNKVLGGLEDVALVESGSRFEPADGLIRSYGIGEARGIEFCSPYGCSKGAADQYVLDYARSFGIPATVFRMSCIYGPHQCGNEDQGWVAHFLLQTLREESITFFGNGKQVRDLLHVRDLVDAFLTAQASPNTAGQAFNIGGSPENAVSLIELMRLISELHGRSPVLRFEGWRPSDQRYYVSDIRKFSEATGWRPRVRVREGVEDLYRWLSGNLQEAA